MRRKNERLPVCKSEKFILSGETPFAVREAYEAARTELLRALAADGRKIVAVTSCSPSEGKSTNCLNLAVITAETGAKVLLVDCDMRKPVIHTLLHLDNKAGLSSFLGGIENDVSRAIDRNVRPNLDVMTSGPIPPNPAELISGAGTDDLLRYAAGHYDYVFIDTPPVSAVTDAFLMNTRIAGIIIVVREGSTRHEDIRECIAGAKMSNTRVLGFIKANCAVK
ncbi:MAG: CpsD/CapB family tyrosine-protein kinase [Ruminiclostridium sp.]|nr:CpsD/CapB family tyrosine-protein kinase [Ruminiclostridium sp.]